MTVYLDAVVILNFLVDFFLLMGTNRLSGFPAAAGRCSVAAAVGGLYGGACLLRGFRFLGGILWRIVALILVSVLAFGCHASAKRRCGIFLLLSFALGGAALQFCSGNFGGLILTALGMVFAAGIIFPFAPGSREYIPVELNYNGQTMSLIALRDTGNSLRDPVSGESVVVIAGDIAQKLIGLSEKELSTPLETLAARPVSGLRLIPYRAVGMDGGFLLAMRLEHVKINNRWSSQVVAFSPSGLGSDHQALVSVQ